MKSILFLAFSILGFGSNAQSVSKIYDHDSSNLLSIYNMPFDSSRLLIVGGIGFSSFESQFFEYENNQLTEITFTDVDSIVGRPVMKDSFIFFGAYLNGLGYELAAYDGISTYFFDFNVGTISSDPELMIFNGELFVIVTQGNTRQLYKFLGGSNFLQISQEINSIDLEFVAQRGDDYFFLTHTGSLPGLQELKGVTISGGITTEAVLSTPEYPTNIRDVTIHNNEVFYTRTYYGPTIGSLWVENIDLSNQLVVYHFDDFPTFYKGGLATRGGDLIYYTSEPNADILMLTAAGQSTLITQVNNTYGSIFDHISNEGNLFFVNDSYLLTIENGVLSPLIVDGQGILTEPSLTTSDAIYLYDHGLGQSGVGRLHEVSMTGLTVSSYDITQNSAYTFSTNAAVIHEGKLNFLFKESTAAIVSNDIYELSSLVSNEELTNSRLTLYPNPIRSNGAIQIDTDSEGMYNIFDIRGRRIAKGLLNQGKNIIKLNFTSSGTYFLHHSNKVEKFMVVPM